MEKQGRRWAIAQGDPERDRQSLKRLGTNYVDLPNPSLGLPNLDREDDSLAVKSRPAERYLGELRWEYGFPRRDMLLESRNRAVAAAAQFVAKLLESLPG